MGTRNHPLVANHPYFITAVTRKRRQVFRDDRAAALIVGQLARLRSEMGFALLAALLAYAVMPEHIHILIVPGPAADLPRIMQAIKGRFARTWNQLIGSSGSVWQPRYFESVVRTEQQLSRWLDYIHHNPVKRGLASTREDYAFSSAGGNLGTDLTTYLGGSWASRAEARSSGVRSAAPRSGGIP